MSQAHPPEDAAGPESLIRWSIGGPHANRGEASSSRPLVPFRQLTFCHLALASMSSAASTGYPECAACEADPGRQTGQRVVDGVNRTRARLMPGSEAKIGEERLNRRRRQC
jgi:hypothetical protein